MKKQLLIPLILFSLIASVRGQTYFSEGFEGGQIPTGWSQIYVSGSVNWTYLNGGHTTEPQFPFTRHPYPAHEGNYNALFQFETTDNPSTKLITKPIDLSYATKPQLIFWHAQCQRFYLGNYTNDELRVYYRKTLTSPWIKILEYTTVVSSWTQRTYLIPDTALSSTFYLAFEGKSKPGWGTCVDDITISETDTLSKSIDKIFVTQASTKQVATSSEKNPVLRIDLRVKGNRGLIYLDTLNLKSLNTNDADVAGVSLYYTTDSIFNNPTLISGNKNFISGIAKFNNLHYSLAAGYNFFWITYDISSSATVGHIVDAMLQSNSVMVSGISYPSTAKSAAGSRSIVKGIFYDGFETNKGWTLSGEFERGAPNELGGTEGGNPDPAVAYSGNNVLGTDLSGLGAHPGDYEPNLNNYAYQSISPVIDCRNYKNVHIDFMRWLNVKNGDSVTIDVKTSKNGSWTNIWTNGSYVTADKEWTEENYDISTAESVQFADRDSAVQVRFTVRYSDEAINYSGWNIDNFIVVGEFVSKDVGVTRWVLPNSGCGHSSSEPVRICVKNFAPVASSDTIPVEYTFDGLNITRDTLFHILSPGDSILFTFKNNADLSEPNLFNYAMANTSLASDQDDRNDALIKSFYIQPTISLPYSQDFESSESFWVSGGNYSSWKLAPPSGIYLDHAASGYFSWSTTLYEKYNNNEQSYVESPCFNFSGIVKPIFEFKLMTDLQKGKDGVALYYSINNGATWNIVPKHSYSWNWNWYNNSLITGLGTAGWDTSTTGGTNYYITAKQVMPFALSNQSQVKFRVKFGSDNSEAHEGVSFDDVKIYEAPAIAGMKSILSHHTNCQNVNPDKISFSIKNNGIRTMFPGKDTIFAGFKINSNASILDTLQLTDSLRVGDTLLMTFHKKADLNTPNDYNIKVFTINMFRNFYPLPDSDTAQINITIFANPVINLADTFRTARLDTFAIRVPYNSAYVYRWSNATHDPLSTLDSLHAPPTGKAWLKITITSTSCTTTDTFFVRKLVPNVGIKTLIDPRNACELSNNVYFKFSIKNNGDDTIRVNDIIKVGFKINSQSIKYENHTVTSRFYPGDTIVHTFTTNPGNFSAIGSYSIKAFTAYKYDSVPGNDTILSTVNVWGYPTVDIGPDTTVMGFYILHTDKTFKTYLWDSNPAQTNSTYKVRNIGEHWVYVTDNHDCPATDSAYIIVHIHDLKPLRISGPVSDCNIGTNKKVRLTISNCGTDTVTTAETIPVGYSMDGGTRVNESISLLTPLYPGDSLEHQFNNNEDFSAVKTYTFNTSVNLTGDIDPSNDTMIDHIYVYGYPLVNLGPDTTLKAAQYTLSAPVGATYAYLWQNDSTYRQYNVTATGKYFVRVTETVRNCVSSDTAYVTLLILDGSITETATNFGCRNSFDSLQVRFMNKGNINIPITDSITLACKINGTAPVLVKHKLSVPLAPNGTFWHTFKNLSNKVNTGANNFKIYPVIPGDLRPENDTLSTVFTIYLPPVVNLGGINDTIRTSPPITLDAGAGTGYTYKWQDLSTNRTLTVITPGFKSVLVTNVRGCVGGDTVYIDFQQHDGGITSINGVSTSCAEVFNQFQATFTNLGETSISSGDTIKFSYKLNGSAPYSEAFKLFSNLNPGDMVNHTFLNLGSKVKTGSNTFKVYAITKIDDYPYNDTMNYTVTIKASPLISLANGKDTAGYTTNYTLDAGAGLTSYLWNTLETTRTITITNPGWYKVTVTAVNGCQNKDSVFMTNTPINYALNIDQDLHVFPNPANKFLNIEIINAGLEDPVIEVYSTDMKLIFTYMFNGRYEVLTKTMDVRDWKPGLYYFRISDLKNNKYYFRKVVIE